MLRRLVRAVIFDRLHLCPHCASSRLNVREECSACRSPQLSQETFIHHFRCAYQATERHFGNRDSLTCPKCRRRLRHFGVDYDRPGTARVCGACSHADADAAIGFVCIDCGAHSDAARVDIRDWYAYALSASGEHRLISGDLRRLRPTNATDAELFHALAEHWLRIQSRYGRPSVVLRLAFLRAASVQADQGQRVLLAARRQAVEIVRGEMRDTDLMIETPEGLLVVLPETEERAVDAPQRRLLKRLSSLMAIDLGIDIRPIDPREMSLAETSATS
ncbi:MAG: hypothetical protein HC834_09165 [Rhodospirillales bacterium]|nr:hypothetical protein [Rhodospirillales bacterium]